MTIDKGWIRKDRKSDEFWNGLQAFLVRCKDHLNFEGKCRCPCRNCNNVEWGTIRDAQAWNDLIDYYIRDDNKRKSLANSNNRGNHRYPTYQGSKSFVEIRHDRRESDGTYPSLIELFKEKRTKTLPNGTTQISDLAMQHYERMKKLLNDQQGVENPMTEDQILDEVLGKRRGFKRGRGHVISGYNSSSSSPGAGTSTPPGRVYTQDDVDALLKATYKRTKRETDFLTKKVDIMAKAMSDHGFDIVWEEPDEEDTSSDSD